MLCAASDAVSVGVRAWLGEDSALSLPDWQIWAPALGVEFALGTLAVKVILGLLAFGGFLLIPFGLPGNWVIAACALPVPWLGLGWVPLVAQVALAGVAELLELTSALKHARLSGASRAGGWGGVLGSIVGAIFLTALIPVPILGTLLGAGLGAFAGALFFEVAWMQRTHGEAVRSGMGAFWGTLIGKALKIALGVAQLVLLILQFNGFLVGGGPA